MEDSNIAPSSVPPSGKSTRTALVVAGFCVAAVAVAGTIFYLSRIRPSGTVSPSPSATPTATVEETPTPSPIQISLTSAKRLIAPADITLANVDVSPKVPAYQLPLDLGAVSNFKNFSNKLPLSASAKSLLQKNGFAAFPTPKEIGQSPQDFADFYSVLPDKDIPVFVTTDSLLHYYHVFFDTALMRMEKDLFYQDVWQMSQSFFNDAMEVYGSASDPTVKEAAKRNIAYLSVALELLKPKSDQVVNDQNVKDAVSCYGSSEYCQDSYAKALEEGTFSKFGQKEAAQYLFTIPDFVEPLVDNELQLIGDHKGWNCSPVFLYQEDYSQYVPRGHYTKSEKLKNYFRAVMWYGRMTDLVKGSPALVAGKCNQHDSAGFVAKDDAKIQTLGASLLARKFALDKDIQSKWARLYAITSFFVGYSDDLGPVDYAAAAKGVVGGDQTAEVSQLAANIEKIQQVIQTQFAKPKIYSGLGKAEMLVLPQPPLTEQQINELKQQAGQLLANTQGFRMLGQREVVDSYLFSKIVSPYSGEYTGDPNTLPFTYVVTPVGRKVRGFPRGLDIFALFGSERASAIIKELGDASYSDYAKTFQALKQEMDALPSDAWYKNLYWSWLYTLKSLTPKFGEGYPTFMQTTAWQDKSLTTALASWAELRHDTILYAKQSYTMAELGGAPDEPIVGYVEPVPEFYARLLNLTKLTNVGLSRMLTKEEMDNIGVGGALGSFDTVLSRLLSISKTELENKELADSDYWFIKYFGTQLTDINKSLVGAGYGGEVDPDMFKTTLVADVHTDGNTKQVLEEGVGYLSTMAVVYRLPDNRLLIGAGPIFSYYEFKHPMSDRLTDEAWRQMLQSNPPPAPEWVKNFSE
ncbi:MAG: DUF3160 domain-containing protein [Patescibacteria group bacterium]|nr:DUF3160 domain-containing protein [Patescibacteria group bacterium]